MGISLSTRLLSAATLSLIPTLAMAQQPSIWIFDLKHFEIEAKSLSVDGSEKTAIFEDALVVKADSDLRLHCSRAKVWYSDGRTLDEQSILPVLHCEP